MKVSVIGAGYVGLVTSACLADLGHEVICLDNDTARVQLLGDGIIPIYEPGLNLLVERGVSSARLKFTTYIDVALEQCEVLFIAVGTPPRDDGSADLANVLHVARQIGQKLTHPLVIVNKSTVPVGTAERVEREVANALKVRGVQHQVVVLSNPEFLKEGAAIEDFMHPDRIVIGVPEGSGGQQARVLMTHLYASLNRHHERTVWMDVRSAELTKYAANAMLATRISFMNEIANLADLLGANVESVRRGIGSDSRIGPSFLYAGTGYGGSCFPKDTRALIQTALDCGGRMQVVEAAERVNRHQKLIIAHRVTELFGDDLRGRKFAIWGLAFKPQTDDMREAPSRTLIAHLLRRGATVCAFDPIAQDTAARAFREDLQDFVPADMPVLVANPMDALVGADALLIATEWKQFHNPDFAAIRTLLRNPLVIDGRNLYDPDLMEQHGLAYVGVGRRNHLRITLTPSVMPIERIAEPALADD